MAKIKKNSHRVLYRKYSSNIKYVMMILSVFIITAFLPKQPRFRYEFEKGEIWKNKDLVSPFSFAILKTTPQVDLDRKDALDNILPVYTLDTALINEVEEAYLSEFDVKWRASGLPDSEKEAYKKTSVNLLRSIYAKGIIALDVKQQKGKKNYDFSLLQNNVSKTLNSADVFTVQTALEYYKNTFTSVSLKVKDLVLTLVEDHLRANIVFDEKLTLMLQENAVNSLS
ncbi:MAG TPA: transmembrane HD family protein, partial [Pedobacter sp.]